MKKSILLTIITMVMIISSVTYAEKMIYGFNSVDLNDFYTPVQPDVFVELSYNTDAPSEGSGCMRVTFTNESSIVAIKQNVQNDFSLQKNNKMFVACRTTNINWLAADFSMIVSDPNTNIAYVLGAPRASSDWHDGNWHEFSFSWTNDLSWGSNAELQILFSVPADNPPSWFDIDNIRLGVASEFIEVTAWPMDSYSGDNTVDDWEGNCAAITNYADVEAQGGICAKNTIRKGYGFEWFNFLNNGSVASVTGVNWNTVVSFKWSFRWESFEFGAFDFLWHYGYVSNDGSVTNDGPEMPYSIGDVDSDLWQEGEVAMPSGTGSNDSHISSFHLNGWLANDPWPGASNKVFYLDNLRFVFEKTYDMVVIGKDETSIRDGSTMLDKFDGTLFGEVIAPEVVTNTFKIVNKNPSGADLNITGNIVITNETGQGFTVIQPATTVVGTNSSVSFSIVFEPEVEATITADVFIPSDSTEYNPYTFLVSADSVPEPILFINCILFIIYSFRKNRQL